MTKTLLTRKSFLRLQCLLAPQTTFLSTHPVSYGVVVSSYLRDTPSPSHVSLYLYPSPIPCSPPHPSTLSSLSFTLPLFLLIHPSLLLLLTHLPFLSLLHSQAFLSYTYPPLLRHPLSSLSFFVTISPPPPSIPSPSLPFKHCLSSTPYLSLINLALSLTTPTLSLTSPTLSLTTPSLYLTAFPPLYPCLPFLPTLPPPRASRPFPNSARQASV